MTDLSMPRTRMIILLELSSKYGLYGTYCKSSGQILQFDELPRLVYECKLVSADGGFYLGPFYSLRTSFDFYTRNARIISPARIKLQDQIKSTLNQDFRRIANPTTS
jgi:hypothetical protein